MRFLVILVLRVSIVLGWVYRTSIPRVNTLWLRALHGVLVLLGLISRGRLLVRTVQREPIRIHKLKADVFLPLRVSLLCKYLCNESQCRISIISYSSLTFSFYFRYFMSSSIQVTTFLSLACRRRRIQLAVLVGTLQEAQLGAVSRQQVRKKQIRCVDLISMVGLVGVGVGVGVGGSAFVFLVDWW